MPSVLHTPLHAAALAVALLTGAARPAAAQVAARIPVGRGAAGILMQPDGARAYVACTPDDDVAVIDVRALAVVGRVRAGRGPDGLAWAARPISTDGHTTPHPSPRATP